MSIVVKRTFLSLLPIVLALGASAQSVCRGQEAPKAQAKPASAPKSEAPEIPQAEAAVEPNQEDAPAAGKLPSPPEIPKVDLVPALPTVTVRHDRPDFNVQMVNASLLPRDKEGIWVLDFAFKPLRIRTVEIPGKGRRPVHYLYYRVVNRTGKPRMFVPQFIMVNEEGKRFEDQVIPQVIPLIQAREDATIPVLGAVDIMGIIPPSTKEGVDDAVFGVAVWDGGTRRPTASASTSGASPTATRRSPTRTAASRRQVQDPPDRLHPPRRRAEHQREGNRARRPAVRVGLLVSD